VFQDLVDVKVVVVALAQVLGEDLDPVPAVKVFEEEGAIQFLLVLVGPLALLVGPAAGRLVSEQAEEVPALVSGGGVVVAAGEEGT
jgi:hypothetical protein